jgi:hypothetical protein
MKNEEINDLSDLKLDKRILLKQSTINQSKNIFEKKIKLNLNFK